jgi:RHS repeat-associated protein
MLPNDDPDNDGLAFGLNLRFPGQYFDAETGLHYNYFRYYDPTTGRYITSDPIGLDGGLNTYTYALNNPLNNIDPDGQFSVVGGLTVIFGGLVTLELYNYYQFYKCVKTCGDVSCPNGDTRARTRCKSECALRYKAGGKGSKGPNNGPIPAKID